MSSRRDSFDLVCTPPPAPLRTLFTPLALHPKNRTLKHPDSEVWAHGRHLFGLFCAIFSILVLAFGLCSGQVDAPGMDCLGVGGVFGVGQSGVWEKAVFAVQGAIFGRLVYVFSVWPYDALVRELGDWHVGTWMVC